MAQVSGPGRRRETAGACWGGGRGAAGGRRGLLGEGQVVVRAAVAVALPHALKPGAEGSLALALRGAGAAREGRLGRGRRGRARAPEAHGRRVGPAAAPSLRRLL